MIFWIFPGFTRSEKFLKAQTSDFYIFPHCSLNFPTDTQIFPQSHKFSDGYTIKYFPMVTQFFPWLHNFSHGYTYFPTVTHIFSLVLQIFPVTHILPRSNKFFHSHTNFSTVIQIFPQSYKFSHRHTIFPRVTQFFHGYTYFLTAPTCKVATVSSGTFSLNLLPSS